VRVACLEEGPPRVPHSVVEDDGCVGASSVSVRVVWRGAGGVYAGENTIGVAGLGGWCGPAGEAEVFGVAF